VTPVFLESGVLGTQLAFVDVAVLDDERGDALGMTHREPQADLRAEVV
jgi:hypothetical protein